MPENCPSQGERQEAQKSDLVNPFQPARVSLKPNQRFQTAANLGDANAVTANEEIAASRNIALEEQYSQSFVELSLSKRLGENHISTKCGNKRRGYGSLLCRILVILFEPMLFARLFWAVDSFQQFVQSV